jgi:hypothetical protein
MSETCELCRGLGVLFGPLDGHGDSGSPCPECVAGRRERQKRLADAVEYIKRR